MEMKVTYKSHYLHEISVWQDVILMLTTDVISLNLTLGITVKMQAGIISIPAPCFIIVQKENKGRN